MFRTLSERVKDSLARSLPLSVECWGRNGSLALAVSKRRSVLATTIQSDENGRNKVFFTALKVSVLL